MKKKIWDRGAGLGKNYHECKAGLPNCVNSKGTHDATSKNFQRYLSQREICWMKVDQKISFTEVQIKVSAGQHADGSRPLLPTVRNFRILCIQEEEIYLI